MKAVLTMLQHAQGNGVFTIATIVIPFVGEDEILAEAAGMSFFTVKRLQSWVPKRMLS